MRRMAANPRLRKLLRLIVPLALMVLLGGCLFPPTPETTQGRDVFNLYVIIFALGAVVFVGVEGIIVWSVIRYRRRDDRLPDQLHGNTLVEIVWTAIPTVIVLFLFIISTLTLGTISAKSANPAVTIEVTGFQWQWTFRYLDDDTNPKNDYQVTGTAAEPPVMGLPVGQPVRLILKSSDVIHSFFVPHFLIKRDVVPFPSSIRNNELEFTITDPGRYAGQCAEFCGDLHARMTFMVDAMASEDFTKWLADAKAGKTPTPKPSLGPEATTVQLSANQLAFDKTSIEVPAGKPFVIHFDNKEAGIQHNVAIADQSGKEVFKGEIFAGPQAMDYQVPALPAGQYTFLCNVHPTMTGALTAK